MFRGSRVENGEYFDDILGRNDEAGIFEGGGGLGDYDRVQEDISPEGLLFQMNCRKCNALNRNIIPWMDLYLVGSNGPGKSPIIPAGWAYSQNNAALYPTKYKCRRCNGEESLCPMYTPDEAQSHIRAAIGRGFVTVPEAQHWEAQVQAYRQQRGG